ncbi:leucine-rich repeat domain-containing protein [uncultured Duncaniella sp.]|uniref:leucine-rich repeat domain-containing protein n=1 Tax=uncultured Duncaniella sp. TaxID=2768039 RepID=UPI0025B70EC9|nr:leucine-rich repeat domain-containing protein [uncultured Duncaniella sp.]
MKLNRLLQRLCCSALGLSALMALSASVSAYDFSSKDRNGIEIFYNINPDGKTVTVTYGGEKYNASNIEIPQEVSNGTDRYTVTAIGNRAFENASIVSVSLPDAITEIQTYAFSQSKISNINYPENLKYIRESAFYRTNISNGIFPKKLEVIESDAFSATQIDSLYLPKSLIALGEHAFNGCQNIRTVKIPGSIKTVSKDVFSNCVNLYKVTIEEGVESLGVRPYDGSVFSQCPITEISYPTTLTYIGPATFIGNKLKEIVLPNTIKELGESCFSSSLELESIHFSSGMEEIPNFVCSNSPKLVKVNIPEGIRKIGMLPFENATLLSHITLPESVTELSVASLAKTGIVNFTFPKKLKYVGAQMFENCENLTEITIPSTIDTIKNSAFVFCTNLRKVTLPETLKVMEDNIFYNCKSLKDINIPSGIGILPSSTFSGCSGMTKVAIPEGITEIGRYAFMSCSKITDIELPKSLQTIRSRVFEGCDALRKLSIYHNVSVIEQHAFDGCLGIEEIHLYRAVLPETPIPQGWLVDRPVIPEGNSCTLYVPKGSGETYKASPYWNTFKEIIEVDMPENLNYQISFPYYTYGGSLTVNGETAKNVMEFAIGSDITISVVPQDGYHLKSLMLNGKDVLSEMTDRSYIIEKLDANYVVDAEFAENPVKLSLFMAVGGSVDVEIEKRATFSCFITPEEGWKVNTVTFNGRDVTSDLTDDNRYTTPSLIGDSELRVTFENVNSAVENIGVNATSTKVYVDRSGLVTIEGIESGTVVSAYAVNGQLVERITSSGDVATLQLYQHGIYLIQTPVKTYKIHY